MTFYDRLLQEKSELDEKKTKLDAFLSTSPTNIPAIHISLLNIQSQIMGSYSQVLLERIALLTPEQQA